MTGWFWAYSFETKISQFCGRTRLRCGYFLYRAVLFWKLCGKHLPSVYSMRTYKFLNNFLLAYCDRTRMLPENPPRGGGAFLRKKMQKTLQRLFLRAHCAYPRCSLADGTATFWSKMFALAFFWWKHCLSSWFFWVSKSSILTQHHNFSLWMRRSCGEFHSALRSLTTFCVTFHQKYSSGPGESARTKKHQKCTFLQKMALPRVNLAKKVYFS